jgi:hypothetical protein
MGRRQMRRTTVLILISLSINLLLLHVHGMLTLVVDMRADAGGGGGRLLNNETGDDPAALGVRGGLCLHLKIWGYEMYNVVSVETPMKS